METMGPFSSEHVDWGLLLHEHAQHTYDITCKLHAPDSSTTYVLSLCSVSVPVLSGGMRRQSTSPPAQTTRGERGWLFGWSMWTKIATYGARASKTYGVCCVPCITGSSWSSCAHAHAHVRRLVVRAGDRWLLHSTCSCLFQITLIIMLSLGSYLPCAGRWAVTTSQCTTPCMPSTGSTGGSASAAIAPSSVP